MTCARCDVHYEIGCDVQIGASADGNVPNGNWNPDESQLKFDTDRARANENAGVRLLARV